MIFVICFLTATVLQVRVPVLQRDSLVRADVYALQNDTCASPKYCKYHATFSPLCTAHPNVTALVAGAPRVRPQAMPAGMHEELYDPSSDIYVAQSCQYELLAQWWRIADALGIRRWSLTAGSLIGYHCYKGIVSWDDDIDIQVHHEDCQLLEEVFRKLPKTSLRGLHSVNRFWFAGSEYDDEISLLRAYDFMNVLRGTWWKLLLSNINITSMQKHPPSLDLLCAPKHEWEVFDKYAFDSVYSDVQFGPGKARVISTQHLSEWCCWRPQAWKRSLWLAFGWLKNVTQSGLIDCLA